jgi:uncharacterized protein YecT (DUF1311 family)
MRLLALALLFPALAFAYDIDNGNVDPAALAQIDKDLNSSYKEALSHLGDPLKKSQRAWLAFRDLDCDAQIQNFGTGVYVLENHKRCIAKHNITRTEQLKLMSGI